VDQELETVRIFGAAASANPSTVEFPSPDLA